MDFKRNIAARVPVQLLDSTTGLGRTGVTYDQITVYVQKQDGESIQKIVAANTWFEVDAINFPGVYDLLLSAADMDTIGTLKYSVLATGADLYLGIIGVAGALPYDSWKLLQGRMKVDTIANKCIIYDVDGTTPIKTWDTLGADGQPNATAIFEKEIIAVAYQFSANNLNSSPVVIMNGLKATMIAAGWTLRASSDGTTTSTTTDQTTGNGTGAGNLGNTNAWFILQQPAPVGGPAAPFAGTRQLAIQRGSIDANWKIAYSVGGFAVGGTLSATALPAPVTAGDIGYILGTAGTATTTFTVLFNQTTSPMRYSICCDDGTGNPTAPFGIWMATWISGAGTMVGGFMMIPMQAGTFAAGDTDPFLFYADGQSGSPAQIFSYQDMGFGAAQALTGWNRFGLSGAAFGVGAACTYGTWGAGSTITLAAGSPGGLGSNPYTGNDDSLPIVWYRGGFKGISSMTRWKGAGRGTADTFTVNNPADRIVVSNMVLPWNGSTAAL